MKYGNRIQPIQTFVDMPCGRYYITTSDTKDKGFMTRIFAVRDGLIDRREKFREYYQTGIEALDRHEYIANNINQFFEEE